MIGNEKMREFVKNNVFDAGEGVTRKTRIERKEPFPRSAISPRGSHRPKADRGKALHLGETWIDFFAKGSDGLGKPLFCVALELFLDPFLIFLGRKKSMLGQIRIV